MIVIWHVRYFDTANKEFKDRDLYLDTTDLDPKLRATIELCVNLNASHSNRDIVQFRQLFAERVLNIEEVVEICGDEPPRLVSAPDDYVEDENGRQISHSQVAALATGNADAMVVPSNWTPYDIEYAQSVKRPIEHEKIALSENQLLLLGYFARDLEELSISAFLKDGPGRLYVTSPGSPVLQTAVNDEEIRAFVPTFRRLYMKSEPASFCSAVDVFCAVVGEHPLTKWVRGTASAYIDDLSAKPNYALIATTKGISFTTKRLIDVYLYTKFLHQPDKRRTRQFNACLADVGGRSDLLMWLFLSALQQCSLYYRNAGKVIVQFFKGHCQYRKLSPGVLSTISDEHNGLGILEKKETLRQKVFRARVEALAKDLWEKAECPVGGPSQFLAEAFAHLKPSYPYQ